MEITRKSTLTGDVSTMDLDVTQDQMSEYNDGINLIQNIFPNLNSSEREFIKSGITPKEWEDTFGSDE